MNPQGDTKYTTKWTQDDPAETLQRSDSPASPAATSEQQLACACPDNRENRAWHACVNNTTDADHQQPTTANHHRPSPSTSQPRLPAPSSFIVVVRHWGLLATTPRPYQGPTKPAPSPRREVPVAWRVAERKGPCQSLSLAAAGV
ncbi:hypothetical protein V500_03798 [Pseudogymnoascus sp. VKM F-4518 (FW-2643)]|nr:hypothetical protein V500_03798 [Pseudogymnoascus sp. VKM F-4518 (FW-2643)]